MSSSGKKSAQSSKPEKKSEKWCMLLESRKATYRSYHHHHHHHHLPTSAIQVHYAPTRKKKDDIWMKPEIRRGATEGAAEEGSHRCVTRSPLVLTAAHTHTKIFAYID